MLAPASIKYTGVLERRNLVEALWQADLFFLVQPQENITAISATLYEYWATGKAPILLFSEIGAASDLVQKNNLGAHFQFKQTDEASKFLESVYTAFRDSRPIWIERSGVEMYDRRKMVEKMTAIWTDAIAQYRTR